MIIYKVQYFEPDNTKDMKFYWYRSDRLETEMFRAFCFIDERYYGPDRDPI
jgi:hypothetical protein